MFKHLLIAVFCLLTIAASWETGDCEEREFKQAIAVYIVLSYIHWLGS